jgi:hypothetical protein
MMPDNAVAASSSTARNRIVNPSRSCPYRCNRTARSASSPARSLTCAYSARAACSVILAVSMTTRSSPSVGQQVAVAVVLGGDHDSMRGIAR